MHPVLRRARLADPALNTHGLQGTCGKVWPMADSSTGDKTEKASQQKLKKSRQEGQVVRSRDLSTAIGILVSLKLFVYLLPGYLDSSASCSPELHAARQRGRDRQRHVDGVQPSVGC
jgi:hypothetical protein